MQPNYGIQLWIKRLTIISILCTTGHFSQGFAQDADPFGGRNATPEAVPTIEGRARHILDASTISELGLTSLQFLAETEAVLSAQIAAGTITDATTVFAKAKELIRDAETSGAWGLQFGNNISPAAYVINRLLTPRAGAETVPSLSHADFALTALRNNAGGSPLFVDRMRIGMLIGSVADDELYAPAADAVKVALDGLESNLSKENISIAIPGYQAFFQRLASDEEELADLLDALRKETTLATNQKRASIGSEMLMIGQVRYARITNDTGNNDAHSQFFRERIDSPELPLMARVLIAESVLFESGDMLSLAVHHAGWQAMISAMEQGAIMPEQARAILTHAGTQISDPDFSGRFSAVAAAWAARLQRSFSTAVRPSTTSNVLLNQLIDLCTQSGNVDELAALASVPVSTADVRWFLTVFEHAEPTAAAAYFLEFASQFDLRFNNSNLSQCIYNEELTKQRLPLIAAQIDDPVYRWLLEVTVAALPDEPLASATSTQTFRPRERRLLALAAQHSNLDFEAAPEVEMAALRWFTEEADVTDSLVGAYAKVGATIQPQDFFTPVRNSSLAGKRRVVTTWLRHSLNDGPAAFQEFLDGLDAPGRFYEIILTVGALASTVHQAFDDQSSNWSSEIRENNLALFRMIVARPEASSFNTSFLGRFLAVGLIFHAVEGQAKAFDTAWLTLEESQRDQFLRGDSGFFQWFSSLLQTATDGRKLDPAAMEAATRGIHDSVVYVAMCNESSSGARRFFRDALAAGIATEELLCQIGPELIRNNPRNGYAPEELAQIQEKAGKLKEAVASWDFAIATAPESSERRYTKAFLAKAGILERAGRFSEALAALKELDSKRLDDSEKTTFQNSLKELRILALSEKRDARQLLQFAANGMQLQPDSIQGRLSAAAVFRALRLKAAAAGNDDHTWAFAFLAAHTLQRLERDEKDSTGGRATTALEEFNTIHVGLGKPGGIVTLIPRGYEWKYSNAAQRADWIQPDFDDNAWDIGPAPLGYGDGDVRTSIDFGDDRRSKPVVTCFRAKFFLRENETVNRVAFSLRRDDAAVVYLNGEEIRRDNLPEDELTAHTTASDKTSGSDENRYFPGPFSPKRLRFGENLIAVAVHQYDQASSDLIFDAELTINDLGADTALKAVSRAELQSALGPLWREVPESIRNRVRIDAAR